MFALIRNSATAIALTVVALTTAPAHSADVQTYYGVPNLLTYWDMQKHLGVVPKFFQLFPEAELPAVWQQYRDVELNPSTALDAKTKELIALAVAAQIPCAACLYFHSAAATANGATGREISEAVAIATAGGDWRKVLTPEHVDMVKKDTEILLSLGTLKIKSPGTN